MGDFQLNTLYKMKQFCVLRKNTHTCFDTFFQWPRGLRSGFVVARLLGFGFESRRGRGFPSLVIVVCCQVQVSVSDWSLARGVLPSVMRLSVIMKPQKWGGPDPLGLSHHGKKMDTYITVLQFLVTPVFCDVLMFSAAHKCVLDVRSYSISSLELMSCHMVLWTPVNDSPSYTHRHLPFTPLKPSPQLHKRGEVSNMTNPECYHLA
jgi:hypothetical protein